MGVLGGASVIIRTVVLIAPQAANSMRELANGKAFAEQISTAEHLKRIDAQAWLALLDLVKQLRPEGAQEIDRLAKRRLEDRRLLGDDNRINRLTEQRDAVGLCLDIAGMDRKTIFRSADVSRADTASSVLGLLDAQPIAERSLIERDPTIFSAILGNGNPSGAFVGAAGRQVRTYVTDATPIETAKDARQFSPSLQDLQNCARRIGGVV